jgi:pseudo-rSAM protein
LIYNSISGVKLEFRDSPGISRLAGDLTDPSKGFAAAVDPGNESSEIKGFISALRGSYSGDIISSRDGIRPVVIRPRPVMLNYPPPADYQDFTIGDYLRNIYFFLNASEEPSAAGYTHAMKQFPCMAYDASGYSELPASAVLNNYMPYDGISGLGMDLTGADLTRYSQLDDLLPYLKKLISPIICHIPLPCHDPEAVEKLIRLKNCRVSFYVTLPSGPALLPELMNKMFFQKTKKRFDFNFVIRSLDEYNMITGLLPGIGLEKVFFLPYYSGENFEFFRDNIFLSKDDILGSKPDQRQVYSRQVLNEHSFGKLYVMPSGEVFPNLNGEPLGSVYNESIPGLVRREVTTGNAWNLTRMKVQPCSGCLYRFLCPPIGNYERSMQRFNFCDIL